MKDLEKIRNIVIQNYKEILGRYPDPEGLDVYTNHMKNGMTIEKFREILMTSYEHKQRTHNQENVGNIVIQTYRDVLRRDPNSSELHTYTNDLNRGLSIYEFYRTLSRSEEYKYNFGEYNIIRDIIIEGYRSILRRYPDPVGLESYINSMKKGMNIERLYETLRTSDEYKQKFKPGDVPIPLYNIGLDKNYFDDHGYIKNNRTEKYKINGKDILICVQTYNGLIYSKRTILSLKEQDCNHNLDLFIIDNCSTDGTLEWLKNMRIKHDILERRRCSAAGMNKCLEKLNENYDYLLLLNNDILLEKNYIGTIVDDFETQNSIMPGCLFMNGVQISHLEDRQIDAIVIKELQDIEDNVMTGDYCAFIIKKEVVDKVGYFDERYTPRYIEDNDFTHRIYLSGGYCIRNGRCKFDHIMGTTFKNNIDNSDHVQTMIDNSMIYKDKWGSFQKGGERFHGMKKFIGKFPFDGGGGGKSTGRGNCSGIFDYKKG